MSDENDIVNFNTVKTETRGNGGKFVFDYCRVGAEISLDKMGCGLFVVPPGKIAFPHHAHSAIEEMCIILDGEGTLRQHDTERPIRAGDIIASKTGVAHQIINTSDKDIRYLVASNQADVDMVHYPDSDKILASSMALDEPMFHISYRKSAVGYYDGEDD